jgi:hypothetical protein
LLLKSLNGLVNYLLLVPIPLISSPMTRPRINPIFTFLIK